MRISGGRARGIQLSVPKGDAVRPATDSLRQAVFSAIAGRIEGARFLDLFAGSGAYGLEALSRGAAGGTFVEKSAKAVACLRENVAAVCRSLDRPTDEIDILNADVLAPGAWSGDRPVDLVFIDPPYIQIAELAPTLFARLEARVPRGAETLVIFEHPGGTVIGAPGWKLLKEIGRGARQPTAAILTRDAAPA